MAEITTTEIKDYLSQIQGREITLADLRKEFNILPGSKSFDAIRNILFRLAEQKIVRHTGKRDGTYKVITQVQPVQVFGEQRERRPLFDLIFPRDYDTMNQMDFAQYIGVREGDLITIGGIKSSGKTTLCLSFCAENIEKHPILMGNEYTVFTEKGYEPAPRFLNRLDIMREWIEWTNGDGMDKFTLLPVNEDYAEHIVKDRINIIDWININGDKLYDIGRILEGIKRNLGRGIAIIALQKGEAAMNPRGGQFVRDFSDVEILLDGFGTNDNDILLTLKGVKEKHKPIVGKTYAYTITCSGTKIQNFREVEKCIKCHGRGSFANGGQCTECEGRGYIDCSILNF